MTRYMLFIGDRYYPGMGLSNYIATFDHLDEAAKRVEAQSEGDRFLKWWQIAAIDENGIPQVLRLEGIWDE